MARHSIKAIWGGAIPILHAAFTQVLRPAGPDHLAFKNTQPTMNMPLLTGLQSDSMHVCNVTWTYTALLRTSHMSHMLVKEAGAA